MTSTLDPYELIVRLIEEGVSLAPISRATGWSVDDLAALPVSRKAKVADAQELGGYAAQLAMRALEEGMRILDEGNDATKIRLITSIANHPLRRMQTDQSKATEEMRGLLDQIMTGGSGYIEEEIEEDEPVGGE